MRGFAIGQGLRAGLVLAVAATALALAARLALEPVLQGRAPFVTFLAAIMACAALRGGKAGWPCLGLGTLCAYVFVLQSSPYSAEPSIRLSAVGLYLLLGGALVLVLDRYHCALQMVRKLNEQLTSAIEVASVGTFEVDLAGRRVTASGALERIYGLEPGAGTRPIADYLARLHPEDAQGVLDVVREARRRRTTFVVEHRIRRPDGEIRWLMSRGSVVVDGEGQRRLMGAVSDMTDRKQTEQRLRLLHDEGQHRARNLFAVLLSVVGQTLPRSEARRRLEERMRAMAAAFTLGLAEAEEAIDLADLVARELAPYDEARVAVDGPAVRLSGQRALNLGLCLHELASNAAKYGALSAPGGSVSIRWHCDETMLRLTWEERGGPEVLVPDRLGFGSRLIAAVLVAEGGIFAKDFRSGGVVAELALPLAEDEATGPSTRVA